MSEEVLWGSVPFDIDFQIKHFSEELQDHLSSLNIEAGELLLYYNTNSKKYNIYFKPTMSTLTGVTVDSFNKHFLQIIKKLIIEHGKHHKKVGVMFSYNFSGEGISIDNVPFITDLTNSEHNILVETDFTVMLDNRKLPVLMMNTLINLIDAIKEGKEIKAITFKSMKKTGLPIIDNANEDFPKEETMEEWTKKKVNPAIDVQPDFETKAITDIVKILQCLKQEEQERVVTYLENRFA